jgi:predicted acylesterase/phospholipase RssA
MAGPLETISPLAMVYGGGGVFGIAYNVGVAHGLTAGGIDVASAPALGTSAGSWAAGAVALGLPFTAFDDLDLGSIPNPRTGFLFELATHVFGEARHPLVAASAVWVRNGRRHILSGARYRLADLAAASSAVPGLFAPHRIDGHLYVDGGMWSTTSVDAAAQAERVIVVAPLAGPPMGPIGTVAGILLGRELRRGRRRYPSHRVTMVRPNREIARMAGTNPLGLFDAERARAVYPLAVEQGRALARRIDDEPEAEAPAA